MGSQGWTNIEELIWDHRVRLFKLFVEKQVWVGYWRGKYLLCFRIIKLHENLTSEIYWWRGILLQFGLGWLTIAEDLGDKTIWYKGLWNWVRVRLFLWKLKLSNQETIWLTNRGANFLVLYFHILSSKGRRLMAFYSEDFCTIPPHTLVVFLFPLKDFSFFSL